ncbi:acyltransferase family protein [Streptomyces boluensis]|uniref:Acyltransferase family protein n=1 Tax=Streptomyces boluensis TaxID=1775135 RepID=A0A964XP11_9ACTN|nr:acyltransferase [Streptomyces boluensis]NBE54741.1 acyltransferase family protein [Streptomyces boluensis]
MDALRAAAILGVVLGHWLVTALVSEGGALHAESPLAYRPWLTPLSWMFQTLAVFFLVGGYVAARGLGTGSLGTGSLGTGSLGTGSLGAGAGRPYGPWLRARLVRLFRPVGAVLALWAVATVGLLASGTDLGTVRTLLKLVLSPLWFLLVLAALTALTPLVARLHPLWPLAVVVHVDLVRFGFDGPEWLGWINVLAGWLVPYCLGAAWARGRLGTGRRAGVVLLVGGVVATVLLVARCGYPASMVGVPGAAVSNLNPPTLAVVTFGLAQCGLALLLHGPLGRAMRRPVLWAGVALANLSALTVFLWHQTALLAVTAVGLLGGTALPGLHTVPDGPGWVLARLAWFPLFGLALAVCWAAFHGFERGRGSRGTTTVVRVHRPTRVQAKGRV